MRAFLSIVLALTFSLTALAGQTRAPETELARLQRMASAGDANAMFKLGSAYYWGLHGFKVGDANRATGLQWYTKAAEKGHSEAMFELYTVLAISRNTTLAHQWLVKAANTGFPPAVVALGEVYLSGDGVAKDTAAGIRLLTKAADGGNSKAMYALYREYWTGKNLPKNDALADQWMARALAAGHRAAKDDLEQFGRPLKASSATPTSTSTTTNPRPSPTTSSTSSSSVSTSTAWPGGLEPGNLYVFELRRYFRPEDQPTMSILLVAGTDAASTKAFLESSYRASREKFAKGTAYEKYPETLKGEFKQVGACLGSNWGATVTITNDRGTETRFGWACGGTTPEAALRTAVASCSLKGKPCERAESLETYSVVIGHSAAAPWQKTDLNWMSGSPSVAMKLSGLTASNELFFASAGFYSTNSLEDSLDKLGKACGVNVCYITSENLPCLLTVPYDIVNGQEVRAHYKCVDTKLTRTGYRP